MTPDFTLLLFLAGFLLLFFGIWHLGTLVRFFIRVLFTPLRLVRFTRRSRYD